MAVVEEDEEEEEEEEEVAVVENQRRSSACSESPPCRNCLPNFCTYWSWNSERFMLLSPRCNAAS